MFAYTCTRLLLNISV